jgi:hypothetical protein
LRPYTRTSFHHQPEAQHPKSSAIHKLPADYPIYWGNSGHWPELALNGSVANDPKPTLHSWSRMSVFGEKADNRYVGAAAKTSYTSADAK